MNILQPGRSGSSSVIRTLIIINVIAYVLLLIASEYAGNQPMKLLALHNWLSPDFKPWQIITHLFLHSTGGVFHLFFNMLALWMFGSALEQTWGAKRFTYYYFACGIGAALVHNTVVGFQLQPMIEAADLDLSNPSYTLFEQFTRLLRQCADQRFPRCLVQRQVESGLHYPVAGVCERCGGIPHQHSNRGCIGRCLRAFAGLRYDVPKCDDSNAYSANSDEGEVFRYRIRTNRTFDGLTQQYRRQCSAFRTSGWDGLRHFVDTLLQETRS